jgi:DNA-binding MarR family transcriptional regulator
MQKPTPADLERGFRIFTWIGIVNQLTTTRATRALTRIGLPFPQFVLLNHFSWRPGEAKTVSGVASAMQQPQPGITKSIRKMIDAGHLRALASRQDGRSKQLFLTAKGTRTLDLARETLAPVFCDAFTGWTEAEMIALLAQIDRLKQWMDTKGRE